MILTRWLRNVLDGAGSRKERRRRAAHRRSAGRFYVPRLEPLEDRITPSGVITINNVFVEDANGNHQSQLVDGKISGQLYQVVADFTTTNLDLESPQASYKIAFNINGFIQFSRPLTNGVGDSGSDSFEDTHTFSFLSPVPGTNQISVTAVPTAGSPDFQANSKSITFKGISPTVGQFFYSAAQIRQAYGIDSISLPSLGGQAADGTGQTIAIIDGLNDPDVFTDLDAFDEAMSSTPTSAQTLFDKHGAASSFLTVYDQRGDALTENQVENDFLPAPLNPIDNNGNLDINQVLETALDVEWAHAIAPGAHIDLIETDSQSQADLQQGVEVATTLSGVSVVSMSWGSREAPNGFYQPGTETSDDAHVFATPPGHTGITFVASSGDNGNPGGYPAFSPHVVAVGGTDLSLNNGDAYGSETAWSTTLNNGSSSYSQVGAWTTQKGGFSGTYSTVDSGGIDNTDAIWTVPAFEVQDSKGKTTVYATWTANPQNATNANYDIHDGTSFPTVVKVDQTKPPNADVTIGNTPFQYLGTFTLTQSTLNVDLDAEHSSGGTVVADALYISPGQFSSSGGGISNNEPLPVYQDTSVVHNPNIPGGTPAHRTTPDVAFEAGGNSTVMIVLGGDLSPIVGTSLSAPSWAGLIAIADQGRAALGKPTLDSTVNSGSTLNALYSLPASDFHDITSGYNGNDPGPSGFRAGPGYDLLTGRGTPIANRLIPDLVNYVPSTGSPPSSPPASPPAPPSPPPPPALNVPPLLALFDSLLGGVETVNSNGTETITDSIFGFPLLLATFDHNGHLVSVSLFGFNVTFLFA